MRSPKKSNPVLSTTGEKGSKFGAGAAGVGGGTLLVLLSNNLPDTSPWKSWLVIAAPSVTVFFSALWLAALHLIAKRFRAKEKQALFSNFKQTLTSEIDDPHTSLAHKEFLQTQLEKVQRLEISSMYDRIDLLD